MKTEFASSIAVLSSVVNISIMDLNLLMTWWLGTTRFLCWPCSHTLRHSSPAWFLSLLSVLSVGAWRVCDREYGLIWSLMRNHYRWAIQLGFLHIANKLFWFVTAKRCTAVSCPMCYIIQFYPILYHFILFINLNILMSPRTIILIIAPHHTSWKENAPHQDRFPEDNSDERLS